MGILYKKSDKGLLEIRNKIFLEKAVPNLRNKGFEESPFSTAWFGKNNLGDFTYELCRVREDSILEITETHISKGDKWIKIFLNVFKLSPKLNSLSELHLVDGMKFDLPPNSLTKMQLRCDDFKGMPLFNFTEHKLKSFNSKRGLEKRIKELGLLIEKDLMNIDSFINRWYELHEPNITDWTGHKI